MGCLTEDHLDLPMDFDVGLNLLERWLFPEALLL